MKQKDKGNLQQCFFRMLTQGNHYHNEDELRKCAQALDIDVASNEWFCIVVKTIEERFDEKDLKRALQIQQRCEHIIVEWNLPAVSFIDGDMDVVLVSGDYARFDSKELNKLQQSIAYRLSKSIAIGVGQGYRELSKLHLSRAEAYEALSWGGDQVHIADIRDVYKIRAVSNATVKDSYDIIIKKFKKGTLDGMDKDMERLAELVRTNTVIRANAPYPSSIRRTIIELLVEMMHIASDVGVDVDEQIDYVDPYRRIFELHGTPAIVQWVFDIAGKLSEAMKQRQTCIDDSMLERIKNYIRINLTDIELSLTMVGCAFGMSPSYLSAFFIREAGVGLKEYITMQRIELAKEYLLKTNDSVNTISEKCGFLSPSYFISVFKNYTKKTPGTFRKKKN